MFELMPKTWPVNVTANTPINLNDGSEVVESTVFTIHNKTAGILRLGSSNSQLWEIPAGSSFSWSNNDFDNRSSEATILSRNIYVNAEQSGDVIVISSVAVAS